MVAHRFAVPELNPAAWTLDVPWIDWISSMSRAPSTRKLAKSVALLVFWWIWKERNMRIFGGGTEPSRGQVLLLMLWEASDWAVEGGRRLKLGW